MLITTTHDKLSSYVALGVKESYISFIVWILMSKEYC